MSVRPRTIALAAAALLAPGTVAHGQATDGSIVTVAGTTSGFAGDGGPATQALMNTPRDVAFTSGDSFVIADFGNDRIRRVRGDGTIVTEVGSSRGLSGDGGPADDAELNRPRGVTSFPGGGYLIADTFNHRIRRVLPDGTIQTVAGTGQGFWGDGGMATSAQLSEPSDTYVFDDGSFLIADTGNGRIRRVGTDGAITTVVDGLDQPRDVTVDSTGAILVADTGNDRILRVAPAGGGRTVVAGTGAPGLSGDGDPARNAQVNAPFSIAALTNGGFIFTDTSNDRVRRVTPLGAIFTVAGTTRGESGNGGNANAAQLNQPGALTLAPGGGFLVADTANAEIRRVSDIGRVPNAVLDRSVRLAPVAGDIQVLPVGGSAVLPLFEEDLVPLRSAFDVTNGRIGVATQLPTGAQQIAVAYEGRFSLTQQAGGYTNFRLPPLDCSDEPEARAATRSAAPRASIAAKKRKRKKRRRLWVSEGGGNWRSSTGSASASAVGTLWRTTLLCEGTRITVEEGIVRVRDKRRGRNRLVRAGESFLVKTTGARRGI